LEEEASAWAANFLVPQADLHRFIADFAGSLEEVKRFAAAQGVAPGIVVGQLQIRGILAYSCINKLKDHYQWSDD
tara:strand:+ start:344 stop:568 length:225 start_codon:yes stop_codon:yes gene_type:complete